MAKVGVIGSAAVGPDARARVQDTRPRRAHRQPDAGSPALACVALIVALASYTILMAIVTIVSVLVSPEVRGVARAEPAI